MRIKSLSLTNFRNIKNSKVEFRGENISGIYGPNGTGKTSVIEAIKLLKVYFSTPKEIKNKNFLEAEKEKISDYIYQGEKYLEIALELEKKDEIYLIELALALNDFDGIMALKESISIKLNKPRSKYKRLISLKNDISYAQPKVFLYEKDLEKKSTDYFSKIQKEIFDKNKTSVQGIILELGNFNSFASILSRETFKLKDSQNKMSLFGQKILDICEKLKMLKESFRNITVISLKEQALSNLEIVIPIKVNVQGTIPVCCKGKENNIYSEVETEAIKETVEKINKLFPLLVQDAKLECETQLVLQNEEEKKYSIEIFVNKNGKHVNIYNESTGTIKLFMLMSALINILKDEDSILLVDELDVHIFEYLLAYILGLLFGYSKGQLIFTAHNLLPMEKLNRDSIILTSYVDNNVVYEYFKGKISSSTNLRLKYLKALYLWSEDNIEPLNIKESKVESTIRELQE